MKTQTTAALADITTIGGSAQNPERREFCVRVLLSLPLLLCATPILAANEKGENKTMGSISVACYKPRPGHEAALLELVRTHLPPLRQQGLVTDREPIAMRTADGTIVEVFEWVSQAAIESAHKNPVVLDLWKRFEAVCTYETPANLKEFQNMFGHFESI
jgi:hypothetical protein